MVLFYYAVLNIYHQGKRIGLFSCRVRLPALFVKRKLYNLFWGNKRVITRCHFKQRFLTCIRSICCLFVPLIEIRQDFAEIPTESIFTIVGLTDIENSVHPAVFRQNGCLSEIYSGISFIQRMIYAFKRKACQAKNHYSAFVGCIIISIEYMVKCWYKIRILPKKREEQEYIN